MKKIKCDETLPGISGWQDIVKLDLIGAGEPGTNLAGLRLESKYFRTFGPTRVEKPRPLERGSTSADSAQAKFQI